MLSEARQERSALRWVRSDLESVLQEARHGLEDYVNGQADRLQVCIERLHQVHRALDLMQVCGAAMLAEEMERLAASLSESKVQRVDAAAEALMLAFVQLPSYLSKVEQGGADVPLALLPVMNDLRAAQDISLVSESALFAPRLSSVIAAETVRPGSGNRALPALLNNQRSHYHRALLNWIRGQDIEGGLRQLQQLLAELHAAAGTTRLQRLLQAAEALVITVLEDPEAPAIAVKPLFGKLDRVLKRIIDQGEEASMLDYPVDLLKNLLFYVSRSESDNVAVAAVKESAVLLGAPMAEAGARLEADDLGRPDRGMFDAVAEALGHDLRDVKDQLDLFMRGDRSQASRLAELAEPVRRIGDTLGMVGQGDLRGRLKRHSEALAAVQAGEAVEDEPLMALASDLLVVESALSDLGAGQSANLEATDADSTGGGRLSGVELQQHAQAAINEALIEMAHVKDGIVEYLGEPGRGDVLVDVVDRLRVVAGVAEMLALPHAGKLLHALEPYLEELAQDRRAMPDASEQDAIADVIVSSELLMRAVIDPGDSEDKLQQVGVAGLEALQLDAGSLVESAALAAGTSNIDNVVALHPAVETTLEPGPPADFPLDEPELDTVDGDAAGAVIPLDVTVEGVQSEPIIADAVVDEPAVLAIQGEVDDEILEVFAEEAVEELGVIQACLPKWQSNPADEESLATIRRSFHTLKGSGRIVGALNLGEFAWAIENLLNRVIDTTVAASPELMGFMTEVVEALPQLVDESSRTGQAATDVSNLSERAFALASGQQSGEIQVPVAEAIALEDAVPLDEPDVAMDIVADSVDEESILRQDFEPGGDEEDSANSGLIVGSADSSLFAVFASEAASHVHVLGDFVSRARTASSGVPFEEGVRRAMHTLRGSARTAGAPAMAELAGALEKLSDIFSDTSRLLEPACVDLFRRSHALLEAMTRELEEPQMRAPDPTPLCEEISAFVEDLAHAAPDLEAMAAAEAGAPTPDDGTDTADLPDPEMLDIFLDEARELLEALEQDLPLWLRGDDPQASVQRLQRTLHTIKGGARLSGLAALGDLSHAMESVFEALAEQRIVDDQPLQDLVRTAVDALSQDVDALAAGELPAGRPQVIDRLEMAARGRPWGDARDRVMTGNGPAADQAATLVPSILQDPTEPGAPDVQAGPSVDLPVVDELPAEREPPDPEMLEIFLEEAHELLDALERELPVWLSGDDPLASVHRLQRTLHTMKGGARLSGLAELGDLSHAMESLFEAAAEQRLESDARLQRLVRHAVDALSQDVEVLAQGRFPVAHEELVTRLEAAAHGRPWGDLDDLALPAAPPAEDIERVAEVEDHAEVSAAVGSDPDSMLPDDSQLMTDSELLEETSFVIPDAVSLPDADAVGGVLRADTDMVLDSPGSEDAMARDGFLPRKPLPRQQQERAAKAERVRVSSDALDSMVNHAGEVSIFRARLEQQNNSVAFNIGELEQTTDRLRKQLRDLEMETETQILSRHEREADSQANADFDPLEMDRYSRIQQLSRALSETVEDLANLGETLTDLSRYTDTLLLQQSRVVTDLQDNLLHTRMVKFGSRAPRLERVVRQTAQGVGKQAELRIVGGGTDVDRTIIERMMGPLEHLLRNAVSHGIEDADEREAAGKPRKGVITLDLAREGSDVVLDLADDGRGLDTSAIRSKAEQRGLLAPNAAIKDDELFELILQPGFSTAAELSQVSGRGVGMDVVLTEVKQLGGNLEIASTPGQGTRFTIRLPFTLAITDSLLVTAGNDIYAVPHSSSDGIVRIPIDKLHDIYAGKKSTFRYGGHDYRVRYLGAMLGEHAPILHDAVRWLPLILVRAGEHRVAIQVDSVLGNRQIVVKSVGVQLSTVPWFTGGTILADGQIALILDVNSLVRYAQAQPLAAVTAEPEAKGGSRGVSVMVVDDSITVRKVTSRLLERHNMVVLTAKDGVDAITQLQEHHPDVMLLDIEMPRMDGYELARHMRSTPELSDIPIVMITSRTGDKHRNRALELGVKRYLGKPYQEAELLENIYAVLAEVKHASA